MSEYYRTDDARKEREKTAATMFSSRDDAIKGRKIGKGKEIKEEKAHLEKEVKHDVAPKSTGTILPEKNSDESEFERQDQNLKIPTGMTSLSLKPPRLTSTLSYFEPGNTYSISFIHAPETATSLVTVQPTIYVSPSHQKSTPIIPSLHVQSNFCGQDSYINIHLNIQCPESSLQQQINISDKEFSFQGQMNHPGPASLYLQMNFPGSLGYYLSLQIDLPGQDSSPSLEGIFRGPDSSQNLPVNLLDPELPLRLSINLPGPKSLLSLQTELQGSELFLNLHVNLPDAGSSLSLQTNLFGPGPSPYLDINP